MKNLGLKIFSLIIGILLALFVGSEGNTSVLSFFVPVELRNSPASKMVVGPQSLQVQVSLRGPSFLVSRIATSPPTFKVRLPDDVDDRYVATLSRADLSLPPDVQVVSIEPSELEIRFDTLRTITAPVIIPKIGSLQEGFALESLLVKPDKVQLTGPSNEIKDLLRAETETLDLRGVNAGFKKTLQLRSAGAHIQIEPSTVEVEASVRAVQLPKRFEKLSVEVRAAAGEVWSVKPDRVDLELSGSRDALERITKEQIIPYVRPQPGSSLQTVKVGVDIPAGISLSVVNPSVVEVKKRTGLVERNSGKKQ
jgi:YbbR domain-containing protein